MAAETSGKGKEEECKEMVKLRSSDAKIFEVEKAVALQSRTITIIMEDMGTQNPIPLPEVSSEMLEKVIEYCKYHVDHPPRRMQTIDDVDEWDGQFLAVDRLTLSHIARAANYLGIKSLLDLVCKTMADILIRLETCENVRRELNIANDFTPEEEEEMRRKYAWAFK